MKKLRLNPLTAIACITLFAISTSYAQDIKINKGKYFNYYHMKYQLNTGEYHVNKTYGFKPGGQFEVLVPKELFSIDAPNCNSHIIIRMPWSKQEKTKYDLYNALLAGKSKTVILELNPYIKIMNTNPLEVELTYCNVFFRHKEGDYYPFL